jgi:hypothetical protein
MLTGDVENLSRVPISTRLDDNLTVPLASVLLGALVFYLIIPPANLQGGSSSTSIFSNR